tara:strand:- start:3992 stop:4714 length:723 start_codon:yes stop_codon:yes gene_type:complete
MYGRLERDYIPQMNMINENQEQLFDSYAYDWWNKSGNYKLLHKLNPLRLQYVSSRFELKNKKVLDIGCGGGIFTEELFKQGAIVTGIDSSKKSIKIAKQHAKEKKYDIQYINASILETTELDSFDCIISFEMIEHIARPNELMKTIHNISHKKTHLFMSTINRNLKSFVFAKVMAEYIMNIVPKGTHQYSKFVTPYELNVMMTKNDFNIKSVDGISFNPLSQSFKFSRDTDMNYFVHAKR